MKSDSSYSFNFNEMARPAGLEPAAFCLVRSYAVQNPKCRFWCRLQGNASFISLLRWTEDGLKTVSNVVAQCLYRVDWNFTSSIGTSGSLCKIRIYERRVSRPSTLRNRRSIDAIGSQNGCCSMHEGVRAAMRRWPACHRNLLHTRHRSQMVGDLVPERRWLGTLSDGIQSEKTFR